MKKKNSRETVLVFVILSLLAMSSGCGSAHVDTDRNLNDVELLRTSNVLDLIGENGIILEKADFPVDLSLGKVYDKIPQAYSGSYPGVYYLFYEYDGYSETSDIKRDMFRFNQYPDVDKEFSQFIIPGGIIGKNLYISMWSSEFGSWEDGINEEDLDAFNNIMEERANIIQVLYEKAFNEKEAILTGKGNSWEVKIPINYFYNQRENKSGITETVFQSSGETHLKYLKSNEELPDVTSMSWSYKNSVLSSTIDEGSILKDEVGGGFYKASPGFPSEYNPADLDKGIIVKITWGNDETEEIICTASQISDMEFTTYETVNNFTDVTMTVKEETISPTDLTVVFENNSDNHCIYGEFFALEKKIKGKWYQVPVTINGNYGFNDIGYELTSGEKEEFKVDWEWLYGSLDAGSYRIIKDILDFRSTGDFDEYYLAAEFTIRD